MGKETLGVFERDVLMTLLKEPANAYGVTIRDRIKERTSREPSSGALYTCLDRLEAKGFVESQWGEATPERGGRRKRFYEIKAPGVQALRQTDERARIWDIGGILPAGA